MQILGGDGDGGKREMPRIGFTQHVHYNVYFPCTFTDFWPSGDATVSVYGVNTTYNILLVFIAA